MQSGEKFIQIVLRKSIAGERINEKGNDVEDKTMLRERIACKLCTEYRVELTQNIGNVGL